jgi:hypothetical protein
MLTLHHESAVILLAPCSRHISLINENFGFNFEQKTKDVLAVPDSSCHLVPNDKRDAHNTTSGGLVTCLAWTRIRRCRS